MTDFYLYFLFLFHSFRSQNQRKFFKNVYDFNLNYMSNISEIKNPIVIRIQEGRNKGTSSVAFEALTINC